MLKSRSLISAALGGLLAAAGDSFSGQKVQSPGENAACQILSAMGVAHVGAKGASKTRSPSHTKRGSGRRAVQGDGSRTAKQRSAGAYGRGLQNWIARTQAARMANRVSAKNA